MEDVTEILSQRSKKEQNKITVLPFRDMYHNIQTDCYMDYLKKYSMDSRWTLFADSDEFLRLPNGGDINSYLKEKEKYTTIQIGFLDYGASGQETYENKPLKERFIEVCNEKVSIVNAYYKELIQTVRIDSMHTHYPQYDERIHLKKEKDISDIVMDHYYTKSWEKWKKKIARGTCDPNFSKKLEEFFLYNPDMEYLKDSITKDDLEKQLYQPELQSSNTL